MKKLLVALFCASMLAAQDSTAPPSNDPTRPVPSYTVAAVNDLPVWRSGKVMAAHVKIAVPVSLTAAEVGKAIAAAAASSTLEWMPKLIDEDTIEATLPIRTHELVVDIAYTATEYTIKYKNSKNLGYNKETQEIHENYKAWLRNLDNGIQRALQVAAIQKALAGSSESRPAAP
jgi:hypothetical protein